MNAGINTLLSNSYYQLYNPSAGTGAANAPNTLAPTPAPDTAPTSSEAYLLDLSPQAQQYLSGTPTASPASSNAEFILSPQQQQAVTAILEKYKDAPQTQDTFNQIQNDLAAAGISPDQLAQQDQVKNFNPTQLLVDDLGGNYDAADALASGNATNEQTKSANYMQQIIKEWNNLSGGAVSAAGGAGEA